MNKFLTMMTAAVMTATGFTATASTGQESRIAPLSGNGDDSGDAIFRCDE